jgi:hypothetical protein
LVLRRQAVETGRIRDGEVALRVDAGLFARFVLDMSTQTLGPVAVRAPVVLL